MAKSTPAGRLSGPGAAGGADPGTNTTSESEAVATGGSPVAGGAESGTTNTTAAEKAESAVVAEGAAPAAPEGSSQFDAMHATGEGSSSPEGGVAIAGTIEEIAGEPGPGTVVSGFVVTHLRIASRSPAGFRRCGRRWGPEPVEVDADEFTEAEILRLLDEPELMVAAVTGGLSSVAE